MTLNTVSQSSRGARVRRFFRLLSLHHDNLRFYSRAKKSRQRTRRDYDD